MICILSYGVEFPSFQFYCYKKLC